MSVELKNRTKKFAIGVVKLVREFPKNDEGSVFGKQLLRSATSVGANYRSACKAKSPADFINKLVIVEEEADECCFWLEMIIEVGLINEGKVKPVLKEAMELTAIFTSSGKTAKGKIANNKKTGKT